MSSVSIPIVIVIMGSMGLAKRASEWVRVACLSACVCGVFRHVTLGEEKRKRGSNLTSLSGGW